MSSQKIRSALGLLQDDADLESAWVELRDAVTSADLDMPRDQLVELLEAALREHESRREFRAVARLLELQVALHKGDPQEAILQAELARVLDDELLDNAMAKKAYKRLLKLRAEDPTAEEALERMSEQHESWREVASRNAQEAANVDDPPLQSSMLGMAAMLICRFGGAQEAPEAIDLLEKAIALDPGNRRALLTLERLLRDAGRWDDVARVLEIGSGESSVAEDRFAALIRLARLLKTKLASEPRAVAAYERALDLQPSCAEAVTFLSDFFSKNEYWDHLVALYESSLRSGAVKPGQELGTWLQIGMVQWRMRDRPDLAEAYFEKIRRVEPAHPGVLNFYRGWCESKGDTSKLLRVLTDALHGTSDSNVKDELGEELSKMAENQKDASKAIDQYKAMLRQDPANQQARSALKRLFYSTEAWPQLVDTLRQELDRTPADDVPGRLRVLREIAEVYRDRMKNDSTLVTFLNQIVQLDDKAIDAVRDLCRVHESLQRWRDLLVNQQKLAELCDDPKEKVELLRAAGRRWADQFQNVQNATDAFEALIRVDPKDEEARIKLRELYGKRRAWAPLYSLCEKELEWADGTGKVQLLLEMARLASERLDRASDAIKLYKRVLDVDPHVAGVMDSLEKQAERDKDYETVADVLERRISASDDEKAKVAVLQKLGALYAERLNDPVRAAGAWRRVLEVQPGQARALRVLRDSYLAAEDYDGLAELYAQTNDWEGLAEVLSSAADRATDPTAKIDLSFRVALVYCDLIGAPERAFRAYERVLSVRPDDVRAAGALVPIYEAEERWSRLPSLYEILLQKAASTEEQLEYLRKLADVTGRRLSDKAAALAYARRAYELAPQAEGVVQLLEDCSRVASSWEPFVATIEARLERDENLPSSERKALRLRVADIYAEQLGKLDEAIKIYRGLVEQDPDDADLLATIDRILRAAERKDDLRWLLDLRAGRADKKGAVRILDEWATLEEDVFGEPARAITLYERALELAPADTSALRSLPRLLIAAGEIEKAAKVLESYREVVSGADLAALDLQLAELYGSTPGHELQSLEAAKRALENEADADRAVAVLDKLMANDETMAGAAEVLVDVYANKGDGAKEASVLAALLNCTTDPLRRLDMMRRLIEVSDTKLQDPSLALDVVFKALSEFPEDMELWGRANLLARGCGRSEDLAQALRVALAPSDKPISKESEGELCSRAALLQDEVLGNAEAAVPYLRRVLAVRPGDDTAFARLNAILTSSARWDELEELYCGAIEGTGNEGRMIELLADVALICEELIENPHKAVGYYERILKLDPLHLSTISALEKLYASEKQYDKLATLLANRLDTAVGNEIAEIKVRLADILLNQLSDPTNAFSHVADVLTSDHDNVPARHLAEQLLQVADLRIQAAEILEIVYEARNETRDLVRVLEIRMHGMENADGRRELLRRIAMLRDEKLTDNEGAFETLCELVPLDPADAQTRGRLVELGRTLGAHEKVAAVLAQAADNTTDPEIRGNALMQVASIYFDLLADSGRAEAVYRRVLDLGAEVPELGLPAARALEEIYAASGDHAALVGILSKHVKLEADPALRGELLGRLGDISENVLGDVQGGIDAWRARLEDEPADPIALASLERLYQRAGRWSDLVEVLRIREQSAADPEDRKRMLVQIAQTLSGKLDDVSDATIAWRTVIDEFGADLDALRALEALYEKSERWIELSETLENHLDLVDSAERLALLAKLGDVRQAHRDDLEGALDAYRQALTIDPSHPQSRSALERLLELKSARREAAQILHPLYEADGEHERLVNVIQIEVDTTDSPDERTELLEQAVKIAEGPLGDAERAFKLASQAVIEAAAGMQLAQWLQTAERLAVATRQHTELASLLQLVVGEILDGDLQLEVTLRIADLARSEIGDRSLAKEYYNKALELRGDERRALIALESLYEQTGDAQELLDIVRRRVEAAEDEAEKKQLLFKQARLSGDVLHDTAEAIRVYESILDVQLDQAAIDALEALYVEGERYVDVISLLERQLDQNPSNKAHLRVKIARVAAENLGDPSRAFDELAEALTADAQFAPAIAELERILKTSKEPEHRARAAEMLEPHYLRAADWKRVKSTIQARLEHSQDPELRRDLLRRLALIQEEQEEDFSGALETTAKLLHEDITDEETWHQLESQARVAGLEKRLAAVFAAELELADSDEPATAKLARRTGELFAAHQDIDSALKFYRRALAFEPESTELFAAVDDLLKHADRAEQRVELYQGALDHRYEPSDRLWLLHAIGELLVGLNRTDEAVDTYRAALDIEEQDKVALDALTALYRQQGDFKELGDLFLRRAESEDELEVACNYRLEFARLLAAGLKDVGAAIDQYEQIVRLSPSHVQALADLDQLLADEEHRARVVDLLLPLYETSDDWRKMVALNAQRFELAQDDLDRVVILRETARLWESRGANANRAFDALRAAFELEPHNEQVRADLERLAAELGAWDELAEAYEAVIDNLDPIESRALIATIAVIHDERRNDPRKALQAYLRLYELDDADPEPLEKLDFLCTLLSDWPTLVKVLSKKAEFLGSDEERASVWRRVGEAKRDMLDDAAGAIEAYDHALELEPSSAYTLDCLIDLHQTRGDSEKLVELYQRRVQLAGDDEADVKFGIYVLAADCLEKNLSDRRGAIDSLRLALDLRAGDIDVLSRLQALYRAEQMWPELLDALKLRAAVADTLEERVSLRRQIGELLAEQLDAPAEALEAFRLVLDESPTDAQTVAAVRQIGQKAEHLRLQVAETLEPVLRAGNDSAALADVLEMKLAALHEPMERGRTLRAIARVHDASLNQPEGALDALLRAFAEALDDQELHADIERLAAQCENGFVRYAGTLFDRARSTYDAQVAQDLWCRAGRICDQHLKDYKRAVEAYTKAQEQAGDIPEVLGALDRLYTELGDYQKAAEILERRVSTEPDQAAQAEMHYRLARLQIDHFGEKRRGLETLRTALELAPTHDDACRTLEKLTEADELFDDAATALEAVYRMRGEIDAMASLYEKRVAHASGPLARIRTRLDLAHILEDLANQTERAQKVVQDALLDDPSDQTVLGELARLAAINSQWPEACRAVAKALQGENELDSRSQRDLYARLAEWYRDKCADLNGAELALLAALERDPESTELLRGIEELQRQPGREKELVQTLRKRAALEVDPEQRRKLFREAKEISEGAIGDVAQAEEILRQLLVVDETCLWALEELTRIRLAAADYVQTVRLLERRAELTESPHEASALKHKAAEILSTNLQDTARAIELYQQIFEADPLDSAAARALREMFASEKRDRDLAALLERLVQIEPNVEERNKIRLELATLFAQKFDAVDDAIRVLADVLTDEPGRAEAVVSLSQLYEKSGRDQDLAELLHGQIELARNTGDAEVELKFTVRLGEVYESRLGDTTKAIETYEQVLARDDRHREALEALSRLFEGKGDHAMAAKSLERLLGILEGEEAVALALRLADIFGKLKDMAGARRSLERALSITPGNEDVRERLRKLYENTGAWLEVAGMIVEDAGAASDDASKLRLLRSAADIHSTKRSDPASASRVLEQACAIAPNDRELLLTLCDTYSASGRGKDAVAALQKVVESYGGKRVKELADVHHRISKAYAADGDKPQAMAELDQAFRINPANIPILVDLGLLALELEDLERANKTFRALLLQRLDDTSPISKAEVFYFLGLISQRQGDPKKAIQMLERALENDSKLERARELLNQLK